MDDKINSINVICPECQNKVELMEDVRVDDIIECPFCGSELRITAFDSDGRPVIEVIQEEK